MRESVNIISAVLIFLFISCEKDMDKSFFASGKKVKTGFIWERTEIPLAKSFKGYKKELYFEDNFNRDNVGSNYKIQGGDWRITGGHLFSSKALNKNAVLLRELPENAIIEFEMWSASTFVDIKFNAWGDGKLHEHGDGYSVIMGGWQNKVSVLSKLHEHEQNRVENREKRFEANRSYSIKFVKCDGKLYWFIDGEIFLARDDKKPLSTKNGYRYLSFANWTSSVHFDNLRIHKLVKN